MNIDSDIEVFTEWQKVNKKHHQEYKDKVKEIKRDITLNRLGKSIKIRQLRKERLKQFFDVRMEYLGH